MKIGSGTIESSFRLTAFLSGCILGDGYQSSTILLPDLSDIFFSYSGNGNFSYLDNFHLKSECPGVGAGTDGTDLGIYGSSSPTSEGWIPSNPHIYFKQINTQTNSSGTLPVQIKVRTGN